PRLAGSERTHRDRAGAAGPRGPLRGQVRDLRLHPPHEPAPRRPGCRAVQRLPGVPGGSGMKATVTALHNDGARNPHTTPRAVLRPWLRPWLTAVLIVVAFAPLVTAAAQTPVTFWYAWGGVEGEVL